MDFEALWKAAFTKGLVFVFAFFLNSQSYACDDHPCDGSCGNAPVAAAPASPRSDEDSPRVGDVASAEISPEDTPLYRLQNIMGKMPTELLVKIVSLALFQNNGDQGESTLDILTFDTLSKTCKGFRVLLHTGGLWHHIVREAMIYRITAAPIHFEGHEQVLIPFALNSDMLGKVRESIEKLPMWARNHLNFAPFFFDGIVHPLPENIARANQNIQIMLAGNAAEGNVQTTRAQIQFTIVLHRLAKLYSLVGELPLVVCEREFFCQCLPMLRRGIVDNINSPHLPKEGADLSEVLHNLADLPSPWLIKGFSCFPQPRYSSFMLEDLADIVKSLYQMALRISHLDDEVLAERNSVISLLEDEELPLGFTPVGISIRDQLLRSSLAEDELRERVAQIKQLRANLPPSFIEVREKLIQKTGRNGLELALLSSQADEIQDKGGFLLGVVIPELFGNIETFNLHCAEAQYERVMKVYDLWCTLPLDEIQTRWNLLSELTTPLFQDIVGAEDMPISNHTSPAFNMYSQECALPLPPATSSDRQNGVMNTLLDALLRNDVSAEHLFETICRCATWCSQQVRRPLENRPYPPKLNLSDFRLLPFCKEAYPNSTADLVEKLQIFSELLVPQLAKRLHHDTWHYLLELLKCPVEEIRSRVEVIFRLVPKLSLIEAYDRQDIYFEAVSIPAEDIPAKLKGFMEVIVPRAHEFIFEGELEVGDDLGDDLIEMFLAPEINDIPSVARKLSQDVVPLLRQAFKEHGMDEDEFLTVLDGISKVPVDRMVDLTEAFIELLPHIVVVDKKCQWAYVNRLITLLRKLPHGPILELSNVEGDFALDQIYLNLYAKVHQFPPLSARAKECLLLFISPKVNVEHPAGSVAIKDLETLASLEEHHLDFIEEHILGVPSLSLQTKRRVLIQLVHNVQMNRETIGEDEVTEPACAEL